jgi:membrane associated rhomboid family serine protease
MPPPRVPRATAAVFAVTATCSILQFPYPALLAALRRDPAALADGQWWRLVTPLVVQDGGVAGTVSNLLFLAVLGVLAERLLGTRRWLVLYAAGAVAGTAAGYAWDPHGAGNSIALCGLAGGVLALAATRPVPAPPLVASAVFAGAVTQLWPVPVVLAWTALPLTRWRPRVAGRVLAAVGATIAVALLAVRDNHGAGLAAGLATGALMAVRFPPA